MQRTKEGGSQNAIQNRIEFGSHPVGGLLMLCRASGLKKGLKHLIWTWVMRLSLAKPLCAANPGTKISARDIPTQALLEERWDLTPRLAQGLSSSIS